MRMAAVWPGVEPAELRQSPTALVDMGLRGLRLELGLQLCFEACKKAQRTR